MGVKLVSPQKVKEKQRGGEGRERKREREKERRREGRRKGREREREGERKRATKNFQGILIAIKVLNIYCEGGNQRKKLPMLPLPLSGIIRDYGRGSGEANQTRSSMGKAKNA